ncbi:MAG: hypothetical protein TRG1_466 [Flavobacteriaceae bacterium FS1-H7996/R]|nr:MAG: hypothetical protein TRG1_466 [Flavobacteriaceae bacterium FS1-H7996/R]
MLENLALKKNKIPSSILYTLFIHRPLHLFLPKKFLDTNGDVQNKNIV